MTAQTGRKSDASRTLSQSKIAEFEETTEALVMTRCLFLLGGREEESKTRGPRDRPEQQGLASQPGMTSTKPRAGSRACFQGSPLARACCRTGLIRSQVWWPPLEQVCKQKFSLSLRLCTLVQSQHSSAVPLHRDSSTLPKGFSQQAARHLVVAKSERKAAVSNFVVSLLPFSSQHFWHCSFQPSGFAASGPRSNADSWEVLTHLFLLSLSTSDLTHLLPLSTHRITLPATVCV